MAAVTVCSKAPACQALLDQSTARAPHRSTASDGICASAAHHDQNPGSDHEPHVHRDGKDWATGVDLTDDKPGGCDADELADLVVARRDARVKYVIRNREMASSYPAHGVPSWTWRPYTGPNPHDTHTHISILPEAINDTSDWWEDPVTPEDRHEIAQEAAGLVIAALDQRGVFDTIDTMRESLAGRRVPTADNPDKRSVTGRIEAGVNALVAALPPKP